MFQIYVGSKLGQTDRIINGRTTQALAESEAKGLVRAAEEAGKSMITSVFNSIRGEVVSGYATRDFEDRISMMPGFRILPE